MHLREKTRRHHRKNVPRARGENRRCMPVSPRCVSPTACRLKRAPTYKKCTRLESCSRDPIGYEDGHNLHAAYFALRNATDPTGKWTWGEYFDSYCNAYCDYVNPWNHSVSVPVDGVDTILVIGTKGGQVTAVVAGSAAVGVKAVEVIFLGGKPALEITLLKGGNVFKVISRPFKCGFRIDPAHHGKPWGHPHWWYWW